jgi:hypothetical protein
MFTLGLVFLVIVGILCFICGFWSLSIVVYNRADECYSLSAKIADSLIGGIFLFASAFFITMSLALTF